MFFFSFPLAFVEFIVFNEILWFQNRAICFLCPLFAQQTHQLLHPAGFYLPGSPALLLKFWLFQCLQIKLISGAFEHPLGFLLSVTCPDQCSVVILSEAMSHCPFSGRAWLVTNCYQNLSSLQMQLVNLRNKTTDNRYFDSPSNENQPSPAL